MKSLLSSLVLLALAAPAAQAQAPRVGFSLNLAFPTGDFSSKTYPGLSSPVYRSEATQRENYDLGLGGQLTVSFPVDPKLAIRLNLGGQVTDGHNTAYGFKDKNLRHSMFSVGGELQIFTQSAYRHRGLYFLAGLSADFERFEYSYGDPGWDYTESERKSRLGGTIGIGHTFGYDAGTRFTLEVAYHTTLTGKDAAQFEPPATDFVKVGFGWVF